MKKKTFNLLGTLILVYALLIFFGGMIGFVLKKSLPSLISGSVFSLLLFFSGIQTMLCRRIGPILNGVFLTTLLLFFAYRFFVTKTWIPAGIMTCLTSSMIAIQWIRFQKWQRTPPNYRKK